MPPRTLAPISILPALAVGCWLAIHPAQAAPGELAGQPADLAHSAYQFRADRPATDNPPEAWILLLQQAGQPFDQPLDATAPAVKKALCGLLWEEVRPIRRVELCWPPEAPHKPAPEDLVLTYFDATDATAHTWWNPRSIKEAPAPEASPDGLAYAYTIPVDTWGIVASLRQAPTAAGFTVPAIRAFGPGVWKQMRVEIEWGYEAARAGLAYDGRLEAYDGQVSGLQPLKEDAGTSPTGPAAWLSPAGRSPRRGVGFNLNYLGTSRWRKIWPYHAQPEDVARTIVTVWTQSGSFSFLAADLENGPILAPEFGFFVRADSPAARPAATPSAGQAPLARELLTNRVDTLPGVPLMRGWMAQIIPWFAANPLHEEGTAGTLKIPARSVAMHPLPGREVAAGWRSPITGRVRARAKVAMADAQGGNGIEWRLVLENRAGQRPLAQGWIGTGGAQQIPTPADPEKSGEFTVAQGDQVLLVVGARQGDHTCDTTLVELAITEPATGREWDLTREVVDSIHAGNPHSDAAGHPAVWGFYSVAPVAAGPAPAQPPLVQASAAATARDYLAELARRNLSTIRQRTRAHPEQSWMEAVAALHGTNLPVHPVAPVQPSMRVELPCSRLTAQWNLGTWHLLRRSTQSAAGAWQFNDYPFGILASETYMILRALDLQGRHQEAADGLAQWLRLPLQPRASAGTHEASRPDRPLGHFIDGEGCLTHATGPEGVGGHMDAVHSMGPGAILFALAGHFQLTGDRAWLKEHAPRMKANAEWILRQRQFLAGNLPGGARLWSKGLQPAQVVTPDSLSMHMQFYETEAYYWLGVKLMAGMLGKIDPAEGARLDAQAEAYRRDLLAAIDRSITLSPVVPVRDGTFHSFIPFAPYVRGFAAGAWGWRRCQGHVGAIYWDTVQSADPLISPAGLLRVEDPRVQGHLDVLEDRLLLENEKVAARTPGFDAERDWFAHASWQYQCGLERHANLHLAAGDTPNFLRSLLNQYAVDIMPGEYTFREHTTGGPPDKIFEEACFLERLRMMLVMEDQDRLWLARGIPRAWLEPGQRLAVRQAPTHFGVVDYEIVSGPEPGLVTVQVQPPTREMPREIIIQLRPPQGGAISGVTLEGADYPHFDATQSTVTLRGGNRAAKLQVKFQEPKKR